MIAVGVSFLVLSFLVSALPLMISSQHWPQAEGIVTLSSVIRKQFQEYDGDLFILTEVYLRYEYEVEGQTYTSTRVNAVDIPPYPEELVEGYSKGSSVTVYYHPRHPSRSLLEPGFVWSLKMFNVFSFLSLAAGVYLIVLGIKERV